jgi:prepilin-type N-terminal cleavage/methylation domain-containing protein
MKRAFSLVELLIVIACIAILMAMLIPTMARARLQAKVVVVNAELSKIAMSLEAYGLDNKGKFPPTRADCNPDTREHWWALPQELVTQGYMTGGKAGDVTYASANDRFNPGHSYKYVAVGPRFDYFGTPTVQYLRVSARFPAADDEPFVMYGDPETSPIKWMIFSLGPEFDEKSLTLEGFPVARKFWYSPKTAIGLITWLRLKNEQHMGTADGD